MLHLLEAFPYISPVQRDKKSGNQKGDIGFPSHTIQESKRHKGIVAVPFSWGRPRYGLVGFEAKGHREVLVGGGLCSEAGCSSTPSFIRYY